MCIGATQHGPALHRIAPLVLSSAGLFSGFVGMFSKASVSVFASSVDNVDDNLARVEPWFFIVLLICCLVAQVFYLNSGEQPSQPATAPLKRTSLFDCLLAAATPLSESQPAVDLSQPPAAV